MERYSRQQRVAGFGTGGQDALASAAVLIVGCGALGTHAADALARAGIGALWLVDRDIVELSNLQRQVLFTEDDAAAGTPKAVAAAARLAAVNGACVVTPHVADCSAEFLRRRPLRYLATLALHGFALFDWDLLFSYNRTVAPALTLVGVTSTFGITRRGRLIMVHTTPPASTAPPPIMRPMPRLPRACAESRCAARSRSVSFASRFFEQPSGHSIS